ncbi:MAG: hypothetical protein NC393_05400 [Clostridium sp.]|nr:hypothetical protein [Clostridium sp.]MCM1171549.1 hypothetical protein [Clostridium sp.]
MSFDDLHKYDNDSDITTETFLNRVYQEHSTLSVEQALIPIQNRLNAYSVERDYINSKEYHDKFEKLPVNKTVQQSLYEQAGRLLRFVDGQEEERLIAINARNGAFIVDNLKRSGNIAKTGFKKEEYKKIQQCKDHIIIMHNHSLNGRPSAQDIISYSRDNHIKLSLIICHDGTIYGIYDVKEEFEQIYSEYLNKAKEKTNNINEAKQLATTEIYKLNDKLNNKRKLFEIRRL